jgi:hypothetical protein
LPVLSPNCRALNASLLVVKVRGASGKHARKWLKKSLESKKRKDDLRSRGGRVEERQWE